MTKYGTLAKMTREVTNVTPLSLGAWIAAFIATTQVGEKLDPIQSPDVHASPLLETVAAHSGNMDESSLPGLVGGWIGMKLGERRFGVGPKARAACVGAAALAGAIVNGIWETKAGHSLIALAPDWTHELPIVGTYFEDPQVPDGFADAMPGVAVSTANSVFIRPGLTPQQSEDLWYGPMPEPAEQRNY